MHVEDSQIKDFIIDAGLISKAEAEEVEKEAKSKKKPMSDVLISKGKFSDDDLRRIQAYILGIPFINLKGQTLNRDILNLVPEPIARKHNIVAFEKKDDALEVAMLDTDDLQALNSIKKKVGLKILPRLTDSESMRSVLIQYQKNLKDDFGDIIKTEADQIKTIAEKSPGEEASAGDLKKLAEELPVVRIVDTLLKHAIIQNSSDIHIEPLEDQILVRYRIDGILHDAMVLPKHIGHSLAARIKVLSNLRLDEKRLPQDGRFKIDMNGEKVSFRVSTLPVYYGEKIVMRLLRESVSGFTLESLGFHGQGLELLHKVLQHTTGMILTTGPTGSGKSTTLYTMIDILNTADVNISTIEDPVEYQMKRVNQTQVKPEIGLTFASGLRTLVRQDPDVIMVGEIRDGETASLAINASLTGHLVLSTLHTNSAAGAVPRLIDMKVEPFLLISTIDAIIAQRLVRKLSNKKEKYYLSKAEIQSISKAVNLDVVLDALREEKIIGKNDDWENVPFFRPEKDAGEDAFKGRIGIYEVLNVSTAIKDLIIKGSTTEDIELQAKKEGMLTMLEDGVFKAAQGLTTIEEVLRVVSE
ncbi:MAG: type II secretion system protein E [Candidatus Woesebacteria bacterium GW2011_GWA1_39_8]|uniref:Type II secretion system protein E n=1 Tax=Candidatus Woesebacteria bacterium GW2011_GWA1_39_8 TaxID=1618552 RepID=A0A0G0PPK5_9BACT|nr:MAG: type II secretion system protein E [Candidatus Woesebacteria bacterium GW2011_GWA1_39_8]